MSQFINQTIKKAAEQQGGQIFPFERAKKLCDRFKAVLSDYLGNLEHGGYFEARGILVTGRFRCGKTREIRSLLNSYADDPAIMPDGRPAKFVHSTLRSTETWKDIGSKTAAAPSFPIGPNTRLNRTEIWEIVVREAKLNGVVGIHFDEVQPTFAGESELAVRQILDDFKTLMKFGSEWLLILIFSGIPKLDDYIHMEEQLYTKLDPVPFPDIDHVDPEDPDDHDHRRTVHEIIGSYALSADLAPDEGLATLDFLDRLIAASAFRWGLMIEIVQGAISICKTAGSTTLRHEHFVQWWVARTKSAPAASPFLHSDFQTMYRRDHPLLPQIAG
ncbi:ATP-binding protein [Thalassococcus sp. S3]|uniref:ATP-binding protein n=1 Tax=Thalassococcus sp. S3 TaxID=2017482 RepID=UPI001023FCC7|nr:ATP-binding protein [Thalassococcus sp. S3]QBF33833.1 transposase [Thalassococcus sp. S3]